MIALFFVPIKQEVAETDSNPNKVFSINKRDIMAAVPACCINMDARAAIDIRATWGLLGPLCAVIVANSICCLT